MEISDVLRILGGAVGGVLGTVVVYLKVLSGTLKEIRIEVKKTNSRVNQHDVRLAVLEQKL